jgi:RNA polymerase sigma-B factor
VAQEDLLAVEEVNTWLIKYKGTQDEKIKVQLRNLIVMACMPFVKKISIGLARRSTDPIEDLIQVGCVGLLKAIEQYNQAFGSSFKTYATYLITGEIRHYLRDKLNMIKAPRELQELSFRINKIVQELTNKTGYPPDDSEIAEFLEIPVSRVAEVIEVDRRKNLISLDQVASSTCENEQALVDKLIDDKYNDFQLTQETRIMLSEAIELLDENLKEAIKLSFFNDLSQSDIAKRLNISQMQVSRRIKKALSQLFEIVTAKQREYNQS